MLDALAAPQACEDAVLFGLPVGRNQHAHRAAHQLRGRVAEQALRGRVARLDHAVEVLRDDRVVCRRHDRREIRLRGHRLPVFGDVERGADETVEAGGRLDRNAVGEHHAVFAVAALEPELGREGLTAGERLVDDAEYPAQVIWVKVAHPPVADFLFERPADEGEVSPVEPSAAPVGAGDPKQDRQRVGHQPEPVIAVAEPAGETFEVADVGAVGPLRVFVRSSTQMIVSSMGCRRPRQGSTEKAGMLPPIDRYP